jgi:uncharacterized lipoprotein YmbA
MKATAILFFLVTGLLAWGCGTTETPAEHLYVLHLPGQDRAGGLDPAGPWFRLEQLQVQDFARGRTIWARVSPIEVEAWRRHRWALPIGDLAEAAVHAWARSCGRFAGVGPPREEAGRCTFHRFTIENFEEVDEGDRWYAYVAVELGARLEQGGKVRRWRGRLTARVPARARHPRELVLAFGRALEEVLEKGWARLAAAPEEEG